jgi:hypothetical protein
LAYRQGHQFLGAEIPGIFKFPIQVGVGQLPILAAGAAEVASQAPEGKPLTPGQKMEHRLLFNGIKRQGSHPSINQAVESAVPVFPGVAPTPASWRNYAPPQAGVTAHPAVGEFFNQKRWITLPLRGKVGSCDHFYLSCVLT